jgi:hypothetical protein
MQGSDTPIGARKRAPTTATPNTSQVSSSGFLSSGQYSREADRVDINEQFRRNGNAFASPGLDYHSHLAEVVRENRNRNYTPPLTAPATKKKSLFGLRKVSWTTPGFTAELNSPQLRLVPENYEEPFPSQRESQESMKDTRFQKIIHPEMDPDAIYTTRDLRHESAFASATEVNALTPALKNKKSMWFRDRFRRNKDNPSPEPAIESKVARILGEDDLSDEKKEPPKMSRETIRAIATSGRRHVIDRQHYDFKTSDMEWYCQGVPSSPIAPSNEEIQTASCVNLSTPVQPPQPIRAFTDSSATPTLRNARSFSQMREALVGLSGKSTHHGLGSSRFMPIIKQCHLKI